MICLHNYSKWKSEKLVTETDTGTSEGIVTAQFVLQSKECTKCGKVKLRREYA